MMTHPLLPKLRQLKLGGMAHTLEARAAQATQQQLTPVEFLALLEDELERRSQQRLARRLAVYTRAELLVIDDFGLKPRQQPAAQDMYDVINERYEKGSIHLLSNRAPAEWANWFTDPLLASAGLDRLSHRALVIIITGDSYRAKDRPTFGEKRSAYCTMTNYIHRVRG